MQRNYMKKFFIIISLLSINTVQADIAAYKAKIEERIKILEQQRAELLEFLTTSEASLTGTHKKYLESKGRAPHELYRIENELNGIVIAIFNHTHALKQQALRKLE